MAGTVIEVPYWRKRRWKYCISLWLFCSKL